MSNDFVPELGQAIFGHGYGSHGMPEKVEDVLHRIGARIEGLGLSPNPADNNGSFYENDVFMMMAYYWGECFCSKADRLEDLSECKPVCSKEPCTCGAQEDFNLAMDTLPHDPDCREVFPNFQWKNHGFEAYWYKYLGRGGSCSRAIGDEELGLMERECLGSLGEKAHAEKR